MLELKNIKKSFGGVQALKNVSLEVKAGEIHAVLGENGAGKSTLMKVISGAYIADSGQMFIDGKELTKNSPIIAKNNGISIIYQEFSLVPSLTVAENIFLGQEGAGSGSFLKWKKLFKKASDLIQNLGFEIDVELEVNKLSVAEQQIVEIAKALRENIKILILDEPTAVLGVNEAKKLFKLLHKLKAEGVSIIYISHHLDELLEISDRVTILKDGETIGVVKTSTVNKSDLIQLMVGRSIRQVYPPKKQNLHADATPIIIKNLVTSYGEIGADIVLNKGKIVGIGGLVGAGRTEILEALFGKLGKKAGFVQAGMREIQINSPKSAIGYGWGMVPEDRKKHGGILHLGIRDNISLGNLSKISNSLGFIKKDKESQIVQDLIKQLQVKISDPLDDLSTLSGGNQQKVILAKWLNLELEVLMVDEPTRGVDVGARSEIYQIIQELADNGVYVLMVSSDMEELMGLSDTILMMRNGKIQGTVDREDFSEKKLLSLAMGI